MIRIAILAAALASTIVPASAGTASTFTDVSACRSVDEAEDVFSHYCAGPAGMAAALLYGDGRAQVVYGPAAKGRRDTVDEARGAAEGDPLNVGNAPRIFGGKIQWVSNGASKPCAAVVRVATDVGSRLVVSRLGSKPKRVGLARTNAEAEAMASKACRKRSGSGPRGLAGPFVSSPSKGAGSPR